MSFSNADTGSKNPDPYKEKNLDEPSLQEKVEGLNHFVDHSKFCLLTTQTPDGLLASRAMALAAKEANGVDYLFHSNSESGKTDDIQEGGSAVNLGFINSSGEWASISGTAKIETSRELVRKYYSPALKAWIGDLKDGTHDGGPEDPRIVLIRVSADTATYAISKKTALGSFIELAKGVTTGDAPDVNKLRQISTAELRQWRQNVL